MTIMKTLHTIYTNFAKRNLARLLTIFIILFTLSIVHANATKVTDKVYTFGSSSTPTGWSVGSSNAHASGYLKLSANDYLEMTVEDIFAEGEILSSNTIKVEVSCGTFGTWSSPKSILCSVELRTSNGEVLTTNNATFSDLSNSESAYRTAIEVNKPNDPAKIAYLRITFSEFNSTSGGTLRVKYVKLNYETSTAAPCTVTLMDDNTTLSQLSVGDAITLPSRAGCTGYTFEGWTKSWTEEQEEWTTTAPTIISAGSYTPTANESLYPVYTKSVEVDVEGTPEDINISPSSFSTDPLGTGNYASGKEYTATINGITLGGHYIAYNNSNTPSGASAKAYIQMQKNNGNLYNITAFPGPITKISISQNSPTADLGLYVGTEQLFASDNTQAAQTPSGEFVETKTGNSIIWEITKQGYTHFCLKKGNTGTSYISSISITYLSGGGTTTTTSYISVPNCCTQLAEVTNLAFSDITSNRITVGIPNTYAGKANASGYTFNCYSASTGGSLVATADENGTSHTFTGLTKNTPYYFTVIAKGEGNYCNSAETSPRELSETLAQYTVTLNPDGGTGDFKGWDEVDGYYTQTVEEGNYVTLPKLDNQIAHTFGGWSDGTTTHNAGQYTPKADVGLTAIWTAKPLTNFRTLCTYDIVLKNNYVDDDSKDGHTTITATHTSFSTANNPATREGYEIEGYYAEPECTNKVADDKGNLVANVTNYTDADGKWIGGETTLYTKWTGRTYTVTLDDNGGSGGSGTITATYGSPMPVITLPTRTGYTFNGYWTGKTTQSTQYYDENGNSLKNWDKAGNTTTLYALWTANANTPYVVKHYKEQLDGKYPEEADDTDNLTGTTASSVTPAVKSYEGFTAPSTQTVSIAADGSTVVTYQYTRNSYKLTWNLAGGTITTEGTEAGDVKYEAPITAPTVAKSGYDFISWSPEVPATMPAANVTCTAQWTANTYTITFDQQEATTQGITTVEATYGSALPSIAENLPSKTGYDFGGYYTEPNGNGTQYYHGTGTGAQHWDIASATTLYAYWKPNTCTLIFNMNGGVGEQPNLTATYDQPMPALTAPLPTLSGFEFSGYFDEKTGGVMYYNAAGESARNWDKTNGQKTLYAQWAAIHTVTWMVNGSQAEGDPTTSVVNGQTITTLPTTPDVDCNGKVFVGWTTATIHGETPDKPSPLYKELSDFPAVTSNMTFYAVFANGSGEERWVETEIGQIKSGDEVVITMTKENYVWTISNQKHTSTAPTANDITANIQEKYLTAVDNEYKWVIEKDNANLTFYSYNDNTNYLYCINDDNGVRIGTGDAKVFVVDGNYLKNIKTTSPRYLGASLNTEPYSWRCYTVTTSVIKAQTLKFYKKTIVYTSYTNYSTSCMAGVCDITNANPIYVTSAVGQKIKATEKLVLTTTDMAVDTEISLSAPNITFYKEGVEITQLTTTAASETFELEIAYQPTIANITEQPTITLDILGYKFTIDNKITARSLPETFAIVAKVGNVWYALPSQGLNSTTPPVAYPVEVDNMADPTAVTAVPENADWSLRQVYASSGSNDRFTANGDNLVFVNNASPAMTLNASSSEEENYLLADARYDGYHTTTNPGLYEWTPTTTDRETYQLTNEQRGRTLSVNTATVFGVHAQNKAVEQVRFLPITGRYTPAALQVVEWKENSVVIMYNGDPAQTASVSVNGGAAQNTTLSAKQSQRDIAVYELAANGLAANPTQRLSITIGSEKTILSIPYIINSETTDATILPDGTVAAGQEVAKVSDLVILKGATLTAAGAKGNPYKFRNVTVYGGGKLVVPADKGFGVNSLTLRIGGVTPEGNYDYVYPEFELNINYDKAFTNTSAVINLDYVTTKSQYYTFVAPFEVKTKDIKYPVDIYGNNVAADNTGSFEFQYYDGAARAAGERGWTVVDEDPTNGAILTAHKGYTFYGMPKKVSVNGGTSTRQKFGIHRIPMSVTAANVMIHENTDQTTMVSAYPSQHNINAGWNLIGNPYMATITGLNNNSIQTGTIVLVDDRWQWSDAGSQASRFIVFPSNDGEWYYTSQATNAELPAFKNFFVQIGDKNATDLSIPRNTSQAQLLAPIRHTDEEVEHDIEMAIVLEKDDAYSDQLDFLINDTYGAGFDYNADFTKMMNATNLNLYGVHMDDNLSFVALDHYSARGSVAIGYQVPAAGEYTLRISDKPYVMLNKIEALYVTDHEMNPAVTTNLMEEDYVFHVGKAEINDTRFTISLTVETNTNGDDITTDMGELDIHSKQPQKFFYDSKLYILRDGKIYSATGHEIKTINE